MKEYNTFQKKLDKASEQVASLRDYVDDATNMISALNLALELYDLYHNKKETSWLLDKVSSEVDEFLKTMNRRNGDEGTSTGTTRVARH